MEKISQNITLTERPSGEVVNNQDFQYTVVHLQWFTGGQSVSGYNTPERVISLLSGLFPGDEVELIKNEHNYIIDARLIKRATERPRT